MGRKRYWAGLEVATQDQPTLVFHIWPVEVRE